MKYEYKLNIIDGLSTMPKYQNGLIVPFVDEARGVRWWQFVNQHGVHMTKVVCIDTGYSVSNARMRANRQAIAALRDPRTSKAYAQPAKIIANG